MLLTSIITFDDEKLDSGGSGGQKILVKKKIVPNISGSFPWG